MRSYSLLAAALLVVWGCGSGSNLTATTTTITSTTQSPGGQPLLGLELELLAQGLSTPVMATGIPGDPRIFVVEQPGTIRIVDHTGVREEPFLDVTRFVEDAGLEQGLLSMAFHPAFVDDGRVYLSFTNTSGDSRVLEYRHQGSDPNVLDPASGRLVLAVGQPHEYHNGGTIRFGPDGNLWVGLGDGGGVGDPWGNAQNPRTLLGAMLRLDVDGADGVTSYAIPADNPFMDGEGGAPEVWAYGLRNPWTFTFTDDDQVVIHEVGHERWEELNVQAIADGGANFGWPVMEADECFEADECDATGMTAPALVVPHERTCALVGGPFYRGSAIPELHGEVFYADFCVGWVRSAHWDGAQFGTPTEWSREFGEVGQITALSEDGDGEILLLTASGELYRIVPLR
jgi:glucose/arabinose dehydrogenase